MHFTPYAFDLPSALPAFGRNHTHGSNRFANMTMIALTIEFSIGQDQSNVSQSPGVFEHAT